MERFDELYILRFMRPSRNLNNKGIKYLTTLIWEWSYFHDHNSVNSFINTLTLIFSFRLDTESTMPSLQHFSNFTNERTTFWIRTTFSKIINSIILNDTTIVRVLLYNSSLINVAVNALIVNAAINLKWDECWWLSRTIQHIEGTWF